MVGDIAVRLVQKVIFAFARDNRNAVVANHPRDIIGVYTSRVDNIGSFNFTAGGRKHKAVIISLNAFHGAVAQKFHAVGHRNFRCSNGQFIRTDNAGGFRKKRADNLVADVRLHCFYRSLINHGKTRHTVFLPSFIERVDVLHFLLGKGKHQRTVVPVRDSQVRAKLRHQRRAAHIELGFQRTVGGVKPAVNDCAVCFCGTHGNIVALVEHGDADILFGKLQGNQRTDHAGTDDYDIILHKFHPICIFYSSYVISWPAKSSLSCFSTNTTSSLLRVPVKKAESF